MCRHCRDQKQMRQISPWLVSLICGFKKVAGDKIGSSPQRYKKALQWINEALSDNEVKNLGTLVHGGSDVLALAAQPPPLQAEESSSGSLSEDSAQPAYSAPIRQYSIVRGAPSIGSQRIAQLNERRHAASHACIGMNNNKQTGFRIFLATKFKSDVWCSFAR